MYVCRRQINFQANIILIESPYYSQIFYVQTCGLHVIQLQQER